MDARLEQAKLAHERDNLAEAEALYHEVLNSAFGNTEVLYLLGTLYLQQGRTGLAAALFKQAISLRGYYPEALQNLGTCFRMENKLEAAEEMFRLTLEHNPSAELWSNLGSLYVNNGTPEQALEYFDKALALQPDNQAIQFNRSLALLELGRWREGWAGYEAGFAGGNRRPRHYRDVPAWDGSAGETIIVWGEQGLGDEIMFASCLPDLIQRSKRVVFDCHPRLVTLFERSFGITCHGTRKTLACDWVEDVKADASVCVSSLAGRFRNEDSDFPGTSFLKFNPDKAASLRAKGDGRLRVGIAWSGGVKKTRTDLRTVPLKLWRPILEQNAEFYSLHYMTDAAREVCAFEEETGLRLKHRPTIIEARDYDETAALVASLDLVISVPTTIVHLAGALGVPCICLTPSRPAWRYGVRGPMRWYRSVTLERQMSDDWPSVMTRVATTLANRIAEHEARAS